MSANEINKSQNFLFYASNDGEVTVQVIVDSVNETIWTSQKGMAGIFDVEVPTINYHLKGIFQSGELQKDSVIRKTLITANDGKNYPTSVYNLDVIIAVGYRVNSIKATQFRIWATRILREYLIKGYALDSERLKQGNQLFGKDYFEDLIERIREIRASERMFYDKLSDILKDCSYDYDKNSKAAKDFYAELQNKFHYAIHQHTAAELIAQRADATKPNMGLTSWKLESKGGKIYKSDVIVAKNYLSERELKELNRLVNMYLDYAETHAKRGVHFSMQEWIDRLKAFLTFYEYPILSNLGSMQKSIADKIAGKQYDIFRVRQDREYKSDFNKFLDITNIKDVPQENIEIQDSQSDNSTFNSFLTQALNYNPRDDKRNDNEDEEE